MVEINANMLGGIMLSAVVVLILVQVMGTVIGGWPTDFTFLGNATESDVLIGKTFYSNSGDLLTGSLGPSYLSSNTVIITQGYYDTNNLTTVDPDLNAPNISDKVTIFGITGNLGLHTGQTTVYDSNGDDATNDGTSKNLTTNETVVLDHQTNLMWQVGDSSDDGNYAASCLSTADGCVNWGEAISYCENLELHGYSDWRLPSILELLTIADFSYPSGSFLNSFFDQAGWCSDYYYYWSSTTAPQETVSAAIFECNFASASSAGGDTKSSSDVGKARCVRDN